MNDTHYMHAIGLPYFRHTFVEIICLTKINYMNRAAWKVRSLCPRCHGEILFCKLNVWKWNNWQTHQSTIQPCPKANKLIPPQSDWPVAENYEWLKFCIKNDSIQFGNALQSRSVHFVYYLITIGASLMYLQNKNRNVNK